MSTVVTFPREKHASGKQMRAADVKNNEDRMIMARILLENVARWVADPSRDEIINMDMDLDPRPVLSAAQIEEMDKNGAGTFGHTTVIEPPISTCTNRTCIRRWRCRASPR